MSVHKPGTKILVVHPDSGRDGKPPLYIPAVVAGVHSNGYYVDLHNGGGRYSITEDEIVHDVPKTQGPPHREMDVLPSQKALGKSEEELEKASRNVKENRERVTRETAHARILSWIQAKGMRPVRVPLKGGVGFGTPPEGAVFDPSSVPLKMLEGDEGITDIDHEAAHALMTPPGVSFKEQQRAIFDPYTINSNNEKVSDPRLGITPPQDEKAAEAIQILMRRRVGVSPLSELPDHKSFSTDKETHLKLLNPSTGYAHPDTTAALSEARQIAQGRMAALDEGRMRVDPKTGTMALGTSIHAKINARALGKSEEELEKASRNVKANRASGEFGSGTQETAHQRIMGFIKRAGFRATPGRQDRFGVGPDQRGLIHSPNLGDPTHELAHALMTPVGEGLREHQQRMGQPSTSSGKATMSRENANREEGATFLMQPQLERRAGVKPIDTLRIGGYGVRPPEERANHSRWAAHELGAFEEGRKMIDPKGNVIPGTSIHAKINARALGKAESGTRWMGRFITNPEHKHQLDRDAGLLWLQGMDPRQAESQAYDTYKKARHAEAAAHHFSGQRAAQGAGDHEQAAKHGALYSLHVKAMGGDPYGAVPPEVKSIVDQTEQPKLYRFKPHPGDAHVLSDQQIQKMEKEI